MKMMLMLHLHDLDIKVVRGHCFLGGFFGDELTKRFIDEKDKELDVY